MGIFEELLQRATDQQQYFYELSSDWNVYKKDELDHLYNYIGYAMYGPPEPPEDDKSIDSDDEIGLYIYKNDAAKKIDYLFKKIIEFGSPEKNKKKQTSNDDNNHGIYCVAFYNFIFADKATISKFEHDKQMEKKEEDEQQRQQIEKQKELENDKKCQENGQQNDKRTEPVKPEESKKKANPLESTIRDIIPVVIFKFKQLKNKTGSCWFMDSDGRIYKHWNDYIKNNNLLKCTMVLPKDGQYQPDPLQEYNSEKTSVFIECHQSPACNSNLIVSILDAANFLGSLGAIGVAAVSCFTPVGAVTMTGAVITGVASGTWTFGRSSAKQVDRYKHEESLASKGAVADWLTIGSSTVGILSIGATKVLSTAIQKGAEISKTGRILHDSITVGGSVLMSGASVTFRAYDMYGKKTKITKSDIFCLVCDIFFLCNSVISIKTAKNIIDTQRTQILDDYKNSLRSNRHRKAFDKLTKGTESQAEVIREINKISQKDEFYATVVKNRRTINKEFSKLPLKERVALVSDLLPAESTESTACTSVLRTFFSGSNKPSSSEVNIQKFAPVYNEVERVFKENSGLIMKELLVLAKRIFDHLSENDTAGEIFAMIVDFLWCKIKQIIRNSKCCTDETSVQFIIVTCVSPLFDEMDNLVSDCQDYLKKKYPHRFREDRLN